MHWYNHGNLQIAANTSTSNKVLTHQVGSVTSGGPFVESFPHYLRTDGSGSVFITNFTCTGA